MEAEDDMSEESLIPEVFFVGGISPETADRLLATLVERAEIRDALVRELVAVARRTHPLGVRMVGQARSAMDARVEQMSDAEQVRAGFLPHAMVECFDQPHREAAVRALGRFLPDEDAFALLWECAVDKDSSSAVRDTAIRAIADDLPHHADALLAAVRAPYEERPLGGKLTGTYPVTAPNTLASFALVIGIDRCDPGLQAEIRRTVRFAYDGPVDDEYKFSDNPNCRVRNELVKMLATPFQADGWGNPELAERIRAAVGTHFLEDFLGAFADHGSVYGEALRLAMAWPSDPRVLDALAGYLETWGGTFISQDVTKQAVWWLGRPEVPVTPRLVAAMDLLCAKPMDDPKDEESHPWTYIGSFSAGEIRRAIAEWRTAKAAAIAALNAAT